MNTSGSTLNYRFDMDESPVLTPCSVLVKPEVTVSERIRDGVYSLGVYVANGDNPYGIYITGNPDEPFTTKGAILTVSVNGGHSTRNGERCAKHLVEALGDKPIKDTDIIGILSDRSVLMELMCSISGGIVEAFSESR